MLRHCPLSFDAVSRFGLEDFKTWLAHFQPARPAGTAWEYSNAGYTPARDGAGTSRRVAIRGLVADARA